MTEKDPPPNPNERQGKPLRIPLPFDDALRAALETPPEEDAERPRKDKGRKRSTGATRRSKR